MAFCNRGGVRTVDGHLPFPDFLAIFLVLFEQFYKIFFEIFRYLCICHEKMLPRRAVGTCIVSMWIIAFLIVSISCGVGNRDSIFTSPNVNEEVYFTNLRLNNGIFHPAFSIFSANFCKI